MFFPNKQESGYLISKSDSAWTLWHRKPGRSDPYACSRAIVHVGSEVVSLSQVRSKNVRRHRNRSKVNHIPQHGRGQTIGKGRTTCGDSSVDDWFELSGGQRTKNETCRISMSCISLNNPGSSHICIGVLNNLIWSEVFSTSWYTSSLLEYISKVRSVYGLLAEHELGNVLPRAYNSDISRAIIAIFPNNNRNATVD